MRALIIGVKENFWVIGEEFKIPGTDERFIVHMTHDIYRGGFVATHLETSQVIADNETIDGCIELAIATWCDQTPENIAARLADRREWVAKMKKERGVAE